MNYKFLVAILLTALAVALQLVLGEQSGIWINFALATLVVAAFFVNFLELLALNLLTIFLLNWQPIVSYELLIFGLLPMALYFARKIFPFLPWLTSFISASFAVLIFYIATSPRLFFVHPSIIFIDLLCTIAFSAIAFRGLEKTAT